MGKAPENGAELTVDGKAVCYADGNVVSAWCFGHGLFGQGTSMLVRRCSEMAARLL
jgi:hypothetical protein